MIAYIKKEDWLKPVARRVVEAIEDGRITGIAASSAVLHEMYYVFSEHANLETMLADFARVTTMKNLHFIAVDTDIYLSALHLAKTHGITSVFDAVYAATALSMSVPDHTVLSTDAVYDKVPGLKRQSPDKLVVLPRRKPLVQGDTDQGPDR